MQPLVEGNGSGRKRGVGVGGFLLALVTAGALAHVAVRMKGIEVAYALGRERRTSAELEEQRRRLQIEIGMLKDPGRVVSLARDKLKMGPPAAGDIVRAGPGALQALPAVPTVASSTKTSAANGQAKAARPAAKTARPAAPAPKPKAPPTEQPAEGD